jgi:hypothetical protein
VKRDVPSSPFGRLSSYSAVGKRLLRPTSFLVSHRKQAQSLIALFPTRDRMAQHNQQRGMRYGSKIRDRAGRSLRAWHSAQLPSKCFTLKLVRRRTLSPKPKCSMPRPYP